MFKRDKYKRPWRLPVKVRAAQTDLSETVLYCMGDSPDTLELNDKESGVPIMRILFHGKRGIEIVCLAPFMPVQPEKLHELEEMGQPSLPLDEKEDME